MMNDELKRLRKEKGLTQVELAERLNLSQATIASWESGLRRPDLDFLPTIADFYGVSVDDLLGRDPRTKKEPATAGGQSVEKYLRLNPENRRKIDELIALYLTAQSADQPPPADPE